MGWPTEESTGTGIYQTTIFTSLLEYFIILFFGVWLIVEYFYNIYEQQYFGSFDPVFLVAVLMIASGIGFVREISAVRAGLRSSKAKKNEDDY